MRQYKRYAPCKQRDMVNIFGRRYHMETREQDDKSHIVRIMAASHGKRSENEFKNEIS